jgi:RNA polymerase sigma-B factor
LPEGMSSTACSPTNHQLDPTALFVRWQRDRDPRARDRLVQRFMPLARKLAGRYVGREPFDDLLQVASLGLLKAIDRFDPDRGTAFSSLAVPTILGELKRYFRDAGWFAHVPRGMQETALKVQEAEAKLSARTGRSPTAQELAAYLELSVEDVVEALCASAAHHSTSLDAPIDDSRGDGATVAERFGEEDSGYDRVEAVATIAGGLPGLSAAERDVILLYFLQDQTQVEIARQIGVSQMQVSRILRRATDRLRELTDPECPEPAGR